MAVAVVDVVVVLAAFFFADGVVDLSVFFRDSFSFGVNLSFFFRELARSERLKAQR